MTTIPIVVGFLGIVHKKTGKKRLRKLEIRGKIEFIQTLARIRKRVHETWGDLLSHWLLWKSPVSF